MKSRTMLLGAVMALVLLAAACSDDGDEGGGGESTPETSSPEVGGDDLSGEPVKVGFVNLEGGVVSVPEIRLGAEAAARYVNDELGGIGGRPLEYVRCDVDGSPEGVIDCANQLVEAGVVAVQTGVAPGADAVLPILESAGLPLVGHSPIGEAQQTAENAFFFSSSVAAQAAGSLPFFAEDGAESVTYFLPEDPGMRAATEEVLEPVAEEEGLDLNVIYYDVANPDWNVLSATAMADGPDVIGSPVAGEPDCIGFIGALRSAGFEGRVLAGNCSVFIDTLGEQAHGVITTSDLWRPDDPESAPSAKQEEIEAYVAAMEAAGSGDAVNSFAFFFFSDTVNLARALSEVEGDVDGAAVAEAMGAISDFDSFMGPTLDCEAAHADGQSACGAGMLVYEVTEEGTQTALTEDFIDLTELLDV